MRRRIRRRDFLVRYLGNTMLAAGGSLFGAAAAYEIYSHRAVADLGSLRRGNYGLPDAPVAPEAAVPAGSPVAVAAATDASPQPDGAAAAVASSVPDSPSGPEPAVFAAATPAVQAAGVKPAMLPIKLRIQSIGISDAKVIEVGTRIEKGQLVWETADHAVGHHVGTAMPGQTGNMVLSGHISSPVRGEGNVFRNLPNIKDKLGSTVSVQTADGTWFHYDIVGTNVVTPADTWVLNPTATPMLTLLTCVPDGVYTYRFVALGKFSGNG